MDTIFYKMKWSFLVISFTCALIACAQPKIIIHAYSQQFTPGTIPTRDVVGENADDFIKHPAVITNYLIYVEVDTAMQITPSAVWVGGKWDTVAAKNIIKTPFITEYPSKKTLVPATSKQVYEIILGDTLKQAIVPTAKVKKQMIDHELIFAYWWNGKRYFAALKKLTVLEPLEGM
ncbi:MAG TPA: hypothetical protein PK695_13095 [Chitinophagaceae bacterium]|jgi:hypothetical protein|nr:hypothetical protein [Chitinophagaceae bacterium]HNA96233.1 hypothetical protein [Chitinophagaceae bacterium]HNF47724.1 hypothetical protein [Chitinophagaceae bacterium]